MVTEPATTRRGELPPELDDPLFWQAIGQFDRALPTAGINPFVAEVLRYPGAGALDVHPRAPGRRHARRLSGLPRPAFERARPDEGRDPLRQGGDARRVRRACDVDDLEVRASAPPVRRREGRSALQPAEPLPRGARAPDAEVHRRAPADHRPAARHPRSRHGHRRADDGLDDGHLLDAGRPRRAGDRHRQAALGRRQRPPARGDRDRGRHGRGGGRAPARLVARRARAASSRATGRSARSRRTSSPSAGRAWSASPTSPAASTTSGGST